MKMPNEINYVPRERVLVGHVVVKRNAADDEWYRKDPDYMRHVVMEAANALARLIREHFTFVREEKVDDLGFGTIEREYRIAVLPERDGRYFSAAVDEAFIAGMKEARRIVDDVAAESKDPGVHQLVAVNRAGRRIAVEIDRRHRLIAAVLTTPVASEGKLDKHGDDKRRQHQQGK